jgi:hypothetical protein
MSFLPTADRGYLSGKGIPYEEVEEGGQKGIIFRQLNLPPGRFDVSLADVLVLLPSGYPDVGPDMFYTLPWVKLIPENRYPLAADQPLTFKSQVWQRWSRHCQDWRAGCDGIWTMFQRIQWAFQVAKL